MKKIMLSYLIIALVASNLFACGGATQTADANNAGEEVIDIDLVDFDESSIKTMGDFHKYKVDEFYNYQDGYNETKFQMVVEVNNTYFRATADMPEGLYDKLIQVDFEKRDEAIEELIFPLPVAKLENLNTLVPSQKELNQYVGKTGQELFDEGWTYMYYNVEDVSAGLYHGPFLYDVMFEYNGPKMENTDDFDFYKEFAPFKVLSVIYAGVGDAIELD